MVVSIGILGLEFLKPQTELQNITIPLNIIKDLEKSYDQLRWDNGEHKQQCFSKFWYKINCKD